MKNKEKALLSLTNDYVFRKIFGEKDVNALADFLSSVLDMPKDDFAEIHVENPQLHREYEDGKGAELDVKVRNRNGEIIDIEIQVNPDIAFRERIAYYNARIFSAQLKHGEHYHKLNRTISVIITDFVLFKENGDCFNRFLWYNEANGTLLTGIQEINTLELPKLPKEDDGTKRWQWLKLLKLREVDEMEAVARDNQAIKDVIVHVHEMSEDEYERRIAFAREKAERDRASQLYSAEIVGEERGEARGIEIGKQDTARGMKAKGFSETDIADITGLSAETITAL